ncbi:MAG: hypothetical protein JO366_15435 [Methylobacteriaceae bacterium]|nr:hypothetical protein [Methylobacteriaceae bacterium]MBV9635652.1 hypothetical protein [Methylobacteriaceae bacterium]
MPRIATVNLGGPVQHNASSLCRILAGAVLAGAVACAAKAAERRSFVIPPADGYGVSECLTKGGACGRLVADSWCEAHGYGNSVTFGRADDVTAAIADAGKPGRIEPGSFIIDCAE